MAIAKPPAGATTGKLVRWTLEVLDAHGVSALRAVWSATVDRFPSATVRGADRMDHFVIRDGTIATSFVVFDQMLLACRAFLLPADGSRADRATAAFNARTRLLARVRDRRRR